MLTLIALEVLLGVDNLIFIAILANKLRANQQERARKLGLMLALGMRIGLLTLIGWIVTLQQPLFDLGIVGPPIEGTNKASFETALSGRDLILLAGGLFLLWKATKEIHHSMEPADASGDLLDKTPGIAAAATASFGAVVLQIIAIDLVFSVESIRPGKPQGQGPFCRGARMMANGCSLAHTLFEPISKVPCPLTHPAAFGEDHPDIGRRQNPVGQKLHQGT